MTKNNTCARKGKTNADLHNVCFQFTLYKITHLSNQQLYNSLKVPHIIDPPARRGHLHSGGFLRVLLLGSDALEMGTSGIVFLVLRLPGAQELRPAVPTEERLGVGVVGGEEVGVHGGWKK